MLGWLVGKPNLRHYSLITQFLVPFLGQVHQDCLRLHGQYLIRSFVLQGLVHSDLSLSRRRWCSGRNWLQKLLLLMVVGDFQSCWDCRSASKVGEVVRSGREPELLCAPTCSSVLVKERAQAIDGSHRSLLKSVGYQRSRWIFEVAAVLHQKSPGLIAWTKLLSKPYERPDWVSAGHDSYFNKFQLGLAPSYLELQLISAYQLIHSGMDCLLDESPLGWSWTITNLQQYNYYIHDWDLAFCFSKSSHLII